MRALRATEGSMRSEPMLDDDGNVVLCQEAVAARDDLIERLCSMPPVPAALDFLIVHFGTDMVSEVTGRERRRTITSRVSSRWSSRSEEHTSELQSLMRISYAVFCLKKKKNNQLRSTLPNLKHHSISTRTAYTH